ncbi:uncharacterized protein [Pleurodeles waltl]|uniref:uncharacterized protein isoform X3 n=1 Tax=Pleurodeles waltl TaxID=8319 RepID=UPI003709587A
MKFLRCLPLLACLGLLQVEPGGPLVEAEEVSMSGSGNGWSPILGEPYVKSTREAAEVSMSGSGSGWSPLPEEPHPRSTTEAEEVLMSGSGNGWSPILGESYVKSTRQVAEVSMSGSGSGWSPLPEEPHARTTKTYPALTDHPESITTAAETYPALTDHPDSITTAAGEAAEVSMSGSGSGWSPLPEEPHARTTKTYPALTDHPDIITNAAETYPALTDHPDISTNAAETYPALTDHPDISTNAAETYPALTDHPDISTNAAETYPALTDHPDISTNAAETYPALTDHPDSITTVAEDYPALTIGLSNFSSAAGLHSLHHLFSYLSEPVPGVPQYFVVGYVDDVPIISYNSESFRAGPLAPWMEKITHEDPRFWEDSAETFEAVRKKLSDSLTFLMEQKKQTMGLNVFQAIEGCELTGDGSANSFEHYAYDGSNFTENTYGVTDNQDTWEFEVINCTEYLKKLLKYGEESLLRRVTPRTMVSYKNANKRTFLVGYAYAFYPREINVTWTQNGVQIPWELKELLPNPDGTYQVRTTVEVKEGDDVMTYELHVNHSSLAEIVTVRYVPPGRSWKGRLLVGVSVMSAVLVGAVTLLWKPLKSFCNSGDRGQSSNEVPHSGTEQSSNEVPHCDKDNKGGSEMTTLPASTHSETTR